VNLIINILLDDIIVSSFGFSRVLFGSVEMFPIVTNPTQISRSLKIPKRDTTVTNDSTIFRNYEHKISLATGVKIISGRTE
jgi:hypothetical protein